MAQYHLARSGRSGRPRQARRAVARDRARACRFRERCWKTPSFACSTPSWRANSTCWCNCSSRIAAGHFSTRDYSADRLREALAALCSRIPAVPHLRHAPPAAPTTTAPSSSRTIAAARRRWQGTDCRHFQFPSRRAHARSYPQRPALQPAAGAQVRAEDAAVHRADGGEVAGGHRALSLSRAARIERGRR